MQNKTFNPPKNGKNGWCQWVQPIMKGYLMQCCDCGLIHEMEFRALEKQSSGKVWWAKKLDIRKYRVEFRVRRSDGK
jgi:hypothetical protein